MSIENPISTTKKAVKSISENNPDNYKRTFDVLKDIRSSSPELLERIIIVEARGKELKDQMGKELYKTYNQVWGEMYSKHEDDIIKINSSRFGRSIDPDNIKNDGIKKILQEISIAIKEDSRIINAFSDKEEFLNKAIDFSISEILLLLESYYR